MTDPKFPNRPNHPDFWLLVEAVQDLDGAADDRTSIERLIMPIVDMDSLTYVAGQRAMRAQKASNPLMARTERTEFVKLQAAWIDAFTAGALYQKYKTERKGKGK